MQLVHGKVFLISLLSAELLCGWGPEALTRFSAIFNLYDLDETGAIDRENYAHLLDRIEKKEGRPVGVPFILMPLIKPHGVPVIKPHGVLIRPSTLSSLVRMSLLTSSSQVSRQAFLFHRFDINNNVPPIHYPRCC